MVLRGSGFCGTRLFCFSIFLFTAVPQDDSISPAGDAAPTPSAPRGSLGIILLTLFLSMVGIGIVIPILPLYAEEFGASEFQIGLILAVYSICQFVFAPFLGKMSDRFGRRPVLLLSTLGSAVGF